VCTVADNSALFFGASLAAQFKGATEDASTARCQLTVSIPTGADATAYSHRLHERLAAKAKLGACKFETVALLLLLRSDYARI
jgi:hypothetical protein